MSIAVAGAGAFGTALAVSLAQNGPVTLWARDAEAVKTMSETRQNPRLDGVTLHENIHVSADIETVFAADTILLAVPAQKLRGFLSEHADRLEGKSLVSCAKGIDASTMTGTVTSIREVVPESTAALLTGPSFAADIARNLPTALTLACQDDEAGALLQKQLTTPNLRLYRTTDTVGAELGGSLKNVMAIACGACIGEGMGDSARAALMTRGMTEMMRLAGALGGRPDTMMGLSGFGDLVLTCTSEQSRNYRYGLALGRQENFDPSITVEGVATTHAVAKLARARGIDMPIVTMLAELLEHDVSVAEAIQALFSRPLKEE
ncbi:NAD(P)-dependent glycerol-3-phosphate dehydrogenase [Marivivens donghaensis]|uniref:Glycerol-3-phosphate dehydrogenase [NAD(P)+] n=1 Tax=Marivivens donghaensis TaxID=1699413 RepID=A0ABX0VU45_9RHOB|nr:NAD(P)H-dependent glycerol-3-phosphate dehydrogenase [Marivivens donghaensis]NIY71411.1 NAD(P)-dependent glycerol-3-phosphate dehydrogenase [Marivivens donghaensis]